MPDTSLPELKLWDPNGFTNSLAAGMKMRQTQNESDRLAYKDEAAVAKRNALSKFYQSPRGQEDVATLAREAPDAVSGIEKNTREAQLAEVQAKKYKAEGAKSDFAVMRDASQALVANPTDENFDAIMASVEPQLSDPSIPKLWTKQWYSAKTPEAREGYARNWAMGAAKAEEQVRKQAEDAKPQPKFFDDGTYLPDTAHPEGGVIQLPGKEPKATPQKFVKTGTGGQAPLNPDGTLGPTIPGTEPPPVETPEQRRLATQTLRNEAKLREAEAGGKQLTDATAALDAHLEKYGTETDIPLIGSVPFTDSHAAEQGTLHADVMAAIQKARQMGVLQPGEFPFLEMAAKNPTSIWNAHQAENIRAQLKVLNAQVGRGLARSRTQFAPPSGATPHPDTSPSLTKPEAQAAPTQEDIEHTAKIHNISPDEVKRRLGIQ
jgi:hypothetical protein